MALTEKDKADLAELMGAAMTASKFDKHEGKVHEVTGLRLLSLRIGIVLGVIALFGVIITYGVKWFEKPALEKQSLNIKVESNSRAIHENTTRVDKNKDAIKDIKKTVAYTSGAITGIASDVKTIKSVTEVFKKHFNAEIKEAKTGFYKNEKRLTKIEFMLEAKNQTYRQ